jgi:competence protein ComEC
VPPDSPRQAFRTSLITHPVLHYSAASITISGFVEIREERECTDRIVARVHHIEAAHLMPRWSMCG